MSKRTICMTVADMKRLSHLLMSSVTADIDSRRVQSLEEEIDRADLVRPEEISAEVVTMNSKVRVRNLDTGDERVFTLVFPEAQNNDEDRVSILDPVATAVLGYSVGDEITWKVSDGVLRLRVEEILYQPEAAGHFYR